MSRRSFLLDLKAEGALALWHDYRRGDAQDLSGNGNHGTLTGNVAQLGRGYQPLDNSSHILVADDPSNRITEGAIIGYTSSEVKITGGYQDLIIKRSVVSNYEMFINPTGYLGFYEGTIKVATILAVGHRCLALNVKNGESGEVYYDGLFAQTLPGGAQSIVETSDSLSTLAGHPTSSQYMRFPLEAMVVTNRKLTATEHAKLYSELANQDWGQLVL